MSSEKSYESDTLSGMYESFHSQLLGEITGGTREVMGVTVDNIDKLTEGITYAIQGTVPYISMFGTSYEVEPVYWDSSIVL